MKTYFLFSRFKMLGCLFLYAVMNFSYAELDLKGLTSQVPCLVLFTSLLPQLSSDDVAKYQNLFTMWEQLLQAAQGGDEASLAQFELEFFQIVDKINDTNKLNQVLLQLFKIAKDGNFLPEDFKNDEAKQRLVLGLLESALKSELSFRGFENKKFKLPTWQDISIQLNDKLNTLPTTPLYDWQENLWAKHFSFLSLPLKIDSFSVLGDATLALKKRYELIEKAQQSIQLLTWGFYDDATGIAFAQKLIAKKAKNPSINITIIVDQAVALRSGYHDQLDLMAQKGIKIVRWQASENSSYGMHLKTLVVDGKYVIQGGRNIGDDYLSPHQWIDLDVYYEMQNIAFSPVFNYYEEKFDLKSFKDFMQNSFLKKSNATSDSYVHGTMIHYPDPKKVDPIYLVTLLSIHNATASDKITIMNAYYVSTPAMLQELKHALKRGVEIQIITNSANSVDEPAIAKIMEQSLQELQNYAISIQQPIKLYVKTGTTLHTKLFVVENKRNSQQGFAWMGSYNLHPRSWQLEQELITFSNDPKFFTPLVSYYQETLSLTVAGQKVFHEFKSNEVINPILRLIYQIFFNQI